MKRYAVECDTPDGGKSIYAECFGPNGSRARTLSEHDSLTQAIQACDGDPETSALASHPWIWDRLHGRVVTAEEIGAAQRTRS